MREGVILSAGVLLLGIIVEGLIRMDAVPGLGDVDVISEAVASVSWISALPEPDVADVSEQTATRAPTAAPGSTPQTSATAKTPASPTSPSSSACR